MRIMRKIITRITKRNQIYYGNETYFVMNSEFGEIMAKVTE